MNDKMSDFYNNDGTPVNPNIVPKPSLCVSCLYDDNSEQETLCMLNRIDQQSAKDFKCFAYTKKE
jgi:hypothetical protein